MRQSRYTGECSACGTAWSCTACLATRDCKRCTPSARCGSCRNVHSKAHRAAHAHAALGSASTGVQQKRAADGCMTCATPRRRAVVPRPLSDAPSAIDVPRTRGGLNTYYELVARTTPDLWSAGGGRWMHRPASAALSVESVVAKDNYETPARIWRHAITEYGLNRDAHASALNAVLPSYDTRDTPGPRAGARYWLNPAFGVHCGGIGAALAAHVWQSECAVVARLPALLHTAWWHDHVMRADAVYYLREKVRFTNPFLDEVRGDYFYSFVLVRWEAQPATTPAAMQPLEFCHEASDVEPDAAQLLRIRRCCACGKYRVLPRYQPEPPQPFDCGALADTRFASCEAACPVWLL